MFQSLVLSALVFTVGGFMQSAAQEKGKQRSGIVTGELKTRKDAKNGRSVTLEILAPGEEKARSYSPYPDIG